jgi:WD40 repeat protein
MSKEVRKFDEQPGPVTVMTTSADGHLLIAGCPDGSVHVYDFDSGKHLTRLDAHAKPVAFVTTSPDGKYVASAGEDNVVKVWRMGTGER